MYDLIALGEVMLRMSPPRYERLRRARTLDVQVVGSQLNVAANLARWGKHTAFVSKLPDNEFGLLAVDVCMSYGVDMSHVPLVSGARMGVNYLEFSKTPRPMTAVYDRKGSAASTTTPQDFDWEALVRGARVVYTDGIFPGLSASCREAATAYLGTAKRVGRITGFDVNYREHLWTTETARECWSTLLPLVDVVVTNRGVSEGVFGFTGTDEEIARQYHDMFGCQLVTVTTREIMGVESGAWSSIALYESKIIEGRRYTFDIVDRYGTGDVFTAGLIYGYLEGDVQFALNYANAACALAHTIEGDIAHLRPSEITPMLNETIDLRVRR